MQHTRTFLRDLWRLTKPYWFSEDKWRARALLALIVVILGGAGSLLGAFVGSFIVGFIYNFGIALVPDLAYFVLFLPMVLVLVFPRAYAFAEMAAREIRYLWWLILFVALGIWLIWGLGRKPKE